MANRETSSTEPQVNEREELPLLPLRDAVLFPGCVMPFDVGRPKTVALAEYLARTKDQAPASLVVTVTQKRASTEDPDLDELHAVGTIARVLGVVKA